MGVEKEKINNMQKMSSSNKGSINETIIAIIVVIVIFFIWCISWICIDKYIISTNVSKISNEEARGTFGDKFGAVNALFSGLAFSGIIFTILLQRKELELQRDELKSTRKVFELQNQLISQDKFENTFFNLLNLYTTIVNSFTIRDSTFKVMTSGRDCFEQYYKTLNNLIRSNHQNRIDFNITNTTKKEVIDTYEQFYKDFRSDLGHYFRTIYHIIKFVDMSDVLNKQQYISIIRAQLSSYEQIMVFYNCLHDNGNEKFKPLIEKYTLFKNIDKSLIYNQEHLKEYEESSYKYKGFSS